jgi:inner membrane transporter RhtA
MTHPLLGLGPNARRIAPALVAVIAATACFQVGAAFAKGLFSSVGPEGAATLRIGLGAAFLVMLVRPWRSWPRAAPLLPLIALGVTVAGVILLFYAAIARLPLALAIALQFLGPLAIAIAGSRRPRDVLWAALAAIGVWLLLGLKAPSGGVDAVGVICALAAAAGWAAYILLGRSVSRSFGASTGALALSIATLAILPLGIAEAGASLFTPAILPLALLVAVFSSVIPFSLEFFALPRLPAGTFAVMTSLEPMFGVLAGFLILGEALTPAHLAGVASVVLAAAGAAWSSAQAAELGIQPT